jgi:malonyl-CoA decarboxylase
LLTSHALARHFPPDRASQLHYKTGSVSTGTVADEAADVRATIARCHDLLSNWGDGPALPYANEVLARYGSLHPAARAAFFDALVHQFSADPITLQQAAEGYLRNPSDATLLALRRAGESPRQELFLRMNAARGGMALLVHMREHLLQGLGDHGSWAAVEADLAHVLRSIFNGGLLEFHQIDCETPAPILEKLIQYEAVHAIHDWREMRRRLEDDRRCYALFHPSWPDEPVIFTELALTRGVSTKVQPILDPASPVLDPASCDAAVFYSITSCQPGLRGFSFGNGLIGRVVDELRAQLPRLRTFATLSPIPGFRSWLSGVIGSLENRSSMAALLAKVSSSGWSDDPNVAAELERDLLPLCAHYLLHTRRGDDPADPVARFHLANGARLRRINWLSDVSLAGMDRSAGLTANYLYYPTDLERNCRTYGSEHKINATRELERLSRQGASLCGPDAPARVWPISA